MTEIPTMQPLYGAQRLGVRMAGGIQPRPVLVTGGGDHKCVILPVGHRVAHEIGVGIGWQVAPIQENLPVSKVFAKNYDQAWSLNDFQRVVGNEIEARTEWQTMDVGRVVLAQILPALLG